MIPTGNVRLLTTPEDLAEAKQEAIKREAEIERLMELDRKKFQRQVVDSEGINHG